MGKVFISHAVVDDAHVDQISKALEHGVVSTWVDHRDIQPGQRWIPSIKRALTECTAGLLVLSEESAASSYNTEECLYLLSADKPVYLVAIEPISPLRVDSRLRRLQRIELYDDFAAGIETLVDLLKHDTEPLQAHHGEPVRVTIEIAGNADEIETRVRRLLAEMGGIDSEKVRVTRGG
jgi:hypothetical protein